MHTHTNKVGHTVAAMSQWALVSGQALSRQLARASSDSGRLVDREPKWTAVSKSTKSCGKKTKLVLAVHSITTNESQCTFSISVIKKNVSKVDFHHSFPAQVLSSSPCWRIPPVVKGWQVVLSLDFIYNQSGRSPVGAWWFFDIRTSRCSEDMNKTYSSSDQRPKTFRVSNGIWGVILKPLSDKCDAEWNMYDIYVAWPGWLSRVQLCIAIKAETGLSEEVCDEWEGKVNGPLITGQEYKQKYYVTIDT